ncbi:MAG: NUDIX hydrolase [Rhodobacterales bacterium]|nr:NUDIX hydrolase [Rhodobacterales bacterium]
MSQSGHHTLPAHRQLAALCYRKGPTGREVLLVTSSTGRWILPKGWPMGGKKPAEAALIEAWEEGGVKKGKVARTPIGSFVGTKITPSGDEEPCRTDVYAVKVEKTVADYPEAQRRDRIWVSPRVAADMVHEDGLREILLRF